MCIRNLSTKSLSKELQMKVFLVLCYYKFAENIENWIVDKIAFNFRTPDVVEF
jgi:hypothetical protein